MPKLETLKLAAFRVVAFRVAKLATDAALVVDILLPRMTGPLNTLLRLKALAE